MGTSRRTVRRWLVGDLSFRRLLGSFVFLYLALFAYAQFVVDRLMFFPPPPSYELGGTITQVKAADGTPIAVDRLVHDAAEFTVLYSHGNAEDLGHVGFVLEMLRNHGYNAVGYDYPGYGRSGGHPGERSACEAIEAVYEYLVGELQVPPERILLLGRSIGSGPAMWLASRRPVGGVILESAMVSAFRVRTRIVLFPFDRFPNLARLRHLQRPVLVIHGEKDATIPIWHGRALYAAAPGPKLQLWVKGAAHDDVLWHAGEAYWAALERLTSMVKKSEESRHDSTGP